MTLAFAILAMTAAAHTFTVKGPDFILDGEPFQIRSGELHYNRIPRAYWKDRLQKAKAMGLNTICTYIFWNLHEPEPDKWDFKDNLDVVAFVKEAQKEGLWVIVRPGPYVCAEWEWGGFPYWLANIDGIKVRQNDPKFLNETRRYLREVGKRLAPLTVQRGGPIIMCQVENEYGSFGNDQAYMTEIREQVKEAGFDCQLFTSDGPEADLLKGGTLPDLPSVINFEGDPKGPFDKFAKFRQNVPRMCGEYWAGWFDHWGGKHAKTPIDDQAKAIEWFMQNKVSFNIYMAHGGTSWGFMNGSNWSDKGMQPDVSSYDYDAAIAEDGRLTPKYEAFRDVIAKYLPNEKLPNAPKDVERIAIPEFALEESTILDEGVPLKSGWLSFEKLEHPYGFVRYQGLVRDKAKGKLEIEGLQDRAIVAVHGKRVGVLDRRLKQTSLDIDVPDDTVITVLVENMGRINYSRTLLDERKGLTAIKLNGKPLEVPFSAPIELDNFDDYIFDKGKTPAEPALYRGKFDVKTVGDTHFDLRGWGKGNVWINGHNLGRYWEIGPQHTLYCPASFLKRGKNDVVVLDLEPGKKRTLSSLKDSILGTG